jgi:uncharacterized protein
MEYGILFLTGIFATTVGTLAGSGGFINFPIMILLGIPVHSAIAANKVSNTISSFSSFFYSIKNKKISLKECYWIFPTSISGGICGGLIANFLPASTMLTVALTLLVFAFITSFFNKETFTGNQSLKPKKSSLSGLFSIGMYDGLFGPGQGTLMMHLLNYLKISYVRAVGYARLATFSSCFGAAITYISTGKVIWSYTVCLLLGSLTGAQIGVRIAEKISPKLVKPILQIVTVFLIIQIVISELFH